VRLTASFAVGRGTTMRATCALRIATTTTRRTAMATLVFAAPEVAGGSERDPALEQVSPQGVPRVAESLWRLASW